MKTKIGQWNGKPTITLNPGAKWPFTFGADKAAMIVDCIDDIRKFSNAYPPKPKHATGPGASRLVLSVHDGSWYAEEMIEPKRSQIIRLFGSAQIVTPYLASMPGAEVVAALQKRNPGAEIHVLEQAPEVAADILAQIRR